MSAPDYSEEQAQARSDARERWAIGTRVRHVYTGGRGGTITKLHVGTLKRQKPIGLWRASVRWDGSERETVHALDLLRVVS